MFDTVLLYLGASFTFLWGFAHLFPTASVIRGFGDISTDNKHIITMEWIVEGIALMFMGILVGMVTVIDPSNHVSVAVYILSGAGLLILAVVSFFTGFRIDFLPFRLCPFIFAVSAVCIFIGGVL